ncbi:GNAT family N-acetyltransferase [Streptomyces sp. SH5]|uniref:GNAT family N-acetyltransferase n=1 Tax=Streptomyces sp. SH5 TaxID=3041765 RepID=UPI002477E490|nr:GNAT family N-acetyltransferase [Streptomyces sp. SH5]WGP13291.1 GNAT family N-acetyltransferase [Streptomyces sp. SH5]
MTWTFTRDVDVFLASAGPSLAERPVEHTVVLGVTERLRRSGARHYGDDDPVLGWWRGADGAVAGRTRMLAGTVRVTSVYTPPEFRGRGYGAAVTAESSRAALAKGAAEVLLFTDLANPTSNGVYLRIGYEPVADRVQLRRGT